MKFISNDKYDMKMKWKKSQIRMFIISVYERCWLSLNEMLVFSFNDIRSIDM